MCVIYSGSKTLVSEVTIRATVARWVATAISKAVNGYKKNILRFEDTANDEPHTYVS